jgi:hypothetical protein
MASVFCLRKSITLLLNNKKKVNPFITAACALPVAAACALPVSVACALPAVVERMISVFATFLTNG